MVYKSRQVSCRKSLKRLLFAVVLLKREEELTFLGCEKIKTPKDM